MTVTQKGLILAAVQCAMVLSLSGKLLYDRATCPRVWVKTAQWDPQLPIRGRYLALRLEPVLGVQWYSEMSGQRVLFFVPEHKMAFEGSTGPEVWAEVTIPHQGPPRPIRLALKRAGGLEMLDIR